MGIAVVVIMYSILFPPQDSYYYSKHTHKVSSMITNISSMVAKSTKGGHIKSASTNKHVSPKISELTHDNVADCADATNADVDSHAYQKMTENEKHEVADEITKYL